MGLLLLLFVQLVVGLLGHAIVGGAAPNHRVGTRYYDSEAGRFISPDPLGHAATPDLYSYAGGDPINQIDPDGRLSVDAFANQASLYLPPDVYEQIAGRATYEGILQGQEAHAREDMLDMAEALAPLLIPGYDAMVQYKQGNFGAAAISLIVDIVSLVGGPVLKGVAIEARFALGAARGAKAFSTGARTVALADRFYDIQKSTVIATRSFSAVGVTAQSKTFGYANHGVQAIRMNADPVVRLASGGGGGITASAAENGLPALQRIHSPATYAADAEAAASLKYWRTQPTEKIVESLKPGSPEALRAWPDGRIFNGNTRTLILEERGVPINNLPREVKITDPNTGATTWVTKP